MTAGTEGEEVEEGIEIIHTTQEIEVILKTVDSEEENNLILIAIKAEMTGDQDHQIGEKETTPLKTEEAIDPTQTAEKEIESTEETVQAIENMAVETEAKIDFREGQLRVEITGR